LFVLAPCYPDSRMLEITRSFYLRNTIVSTVNPPGLAWDSLSMLRIIEMARTQLARDSD